MPKLIANERFYYNGRNVEMGEQFTAFETDVALLTHAVKPMATLPPRGEPPPEPEIDPEPEAQAKPRAYRRRDMKAHD